MSDWWSKKLAGEKPTPERQRFTHPVTSVPINTIPTQQAAPIQQGVMPQQEEAPESFSEALRRGVTKGGEATRREVSTCPACGGSYVFSRTKSGGGTLVGGAAPAPRCYTCGWNGLYEQGDESSWA